MQHIQRQLPQEAEVISKEFFRTIHGYYASGEIVTEDAVEAWYPANRHGRRWHLKSKL
ncbi:MAG: hypothetical protein ACLR2G_09365 [Phascolarctobacterium faecium]